MSLIYSMKMFYFWNFAFLDLREKSKKDLRSFFFFFLRLAWIPKALISVITKQTEIMLEGLLRMDAHLFLTTAKRFQLIIPKWLCQNKFMFLLGIFQVSTLECDKIHFIFFLNLRSGQNHIQMTKPTSSNDHNAGST